MTGPDMAESGAGEAPEYLRPVGPWPHIARQAHAGKAE